jgi:hypothetical protein
MTSGVRRAVPSVLAGVIFLALGPVACASAPLAGPGASSPQPALAGTVAVIPGAARQVTLGLNYGLNAGGRKPPTPVTITGSGKVSELAGLVASQPPWPPGTYSCPDDNGTTLTLTFRAHPGGPALATAVLDLTGCGGTALTVGAKEHELGMESARPLATKVLEVAGVPWRLPPFQWPPA